MQWPKVPPGQHWIWDCVTEQSIGNLKNLAAALVDLHATLRMSGMPEENASNLKVPLTWEMLQLMSLST